MRLFFDANLKIKQVGYFNLEIRKDGLHAPKALSEAVESKMKTVEDFVDCLERYPHAFMRVTKWENPEILAHACSQMAKLLQGLISPREMRRLLEPSWMWNEEPEDSDVPAEKSRDSRARV